MLPIRKFFVLAGVSVIVFAMTACEKKKDVVKEAGPIPVTAVVAVSQNLPVSRSFVGKVVSYDKIDVKARVQGFLKKRAFTEGGLVKKGDLLYSIEKNQYEIALNQAEANLAQAEAEAVNAEIQLERARQLIKTGDIARSTLDNREAAAGSAMAVVRQARAAADDAKLNLSYTDIKAPFTGRIGLSAYDIGEYITPSSGSLATLVSLDPMGVQFAISMQDISAMYVAVGGKVPSITAKLLLSDNREYAYKGKIDFVDNAVSQLTDTLKMRAKFDNPKGLLVDGSVVSITITTEAKYPTVVIPQVALQQDQAGRYVMVIKEDNKVELRRVSTGIEIEKNIVVSSGLKAGEVIVVEGLQKIKQGVAVKANVLDMQRFNNETVADK